MSNLSIQTNDSNDIFVGSDGNLTMANDIEALKQDCEHALKTQLGEMFLNPAGGMPTLTDVWLSRNFIKWEAVARATLIKINGVVNIQNFTMTTSGDIFEYTARILTVYSPTLLNVSGILGQPT